MRKLHLLLIVSLFLSALSCKKDDAPTKKDLLCGKNWILVSETVSPAINFNGILITDLYAQLDDCTKDDISKFNTNGTYTFEEGATKCDVNDPQVWDSGTWVFNSDQTVLVLTSPSMGTVNADIIELTSSKIVISQESTIDDIKYTITDTYQKK
jgi:hypothetical protein